jgi:copper chaperone CopZ
VGAWARGERQTVVFDVDIHCQGCITKIEKNIAFERGVKDMECSLEDRTVTIVFDPSKTSVEQLQAAFAKINKTAKVHQDKAEDQSADVDAQSGASTMESEK